MRDADLDDGPAGGAELDDHLGREEGAAGFDPEPFERLAPEELAGAVDIGDREAEEDAVGEAIGARVGDPQRRVGALDPEADDDIGAVRLGQPRGQAADVGDLELAVAVGEGDELVAGGSEAGAKRGAVAEVGRVVDDADDVGVGGGEGVGERRGAVLGAVIDRDDLEGVGEGRERLERLVDEALEVGLLVVRREEVREARETGRPGAVDMRPIVGAASRGV